MQTNWQVGARCSGAKAVLLNDWEYFLNYSERGSDGEKNLKMACSFIYKPHEMTKQVEWK